MMAKGIKGRKTVLMTLTIPNHGYIIGDTVMLTGLMPGNAKAGEYRITDVLSTGQMLVEPSPWWLRLWNSIKRIVRAVKAYRCSN